MNGFLLIDKPAGYTSRDISTQVGKLLYTKKVGHVGTLDPFATGLLILMVNKATKSLICFEDFPKRYVATIKLGEYRDSLDLTGAVIETKEVPILTKEKVENVLQSFLGKSMQTVPLTSAKHVNGKRLYEYAHKGQEIELPTQEIEVYDIKLVDFNNDKITFEAFVSKGTYIRTLGADIANRMGTCGFLESLRRTNVGPFDVKDAIKIEEVKEDKIIPTSFVLSEFMKTVIVDDSFALDIKNGKVKVYPLEATEDKLLVIDQKNEPIALYTKEENQYIFRRGLF